VQIIVFILKVISVINLFFAHIGSRAFRGTHPALTTLIAIGQFSSTVAATWSQLKAAKSRSWPLLSQAQLLCILTVSTRPGAEPYRTRLAGKPTPKASKSSLSSVNVSVWVRTPRLVGTRPSVTAYVLSAAALTIAIVPFGAGLLRPAATVSVTKV